MCAGRRPYTSYYRGRVTCFRFSFSAAEVYRVLENRLPFLHHCYIHYSPLYNMLCPSYPILSVILIMQSALLSQTSQSSRKSSNELAELLSRNCIQVEVAAPNELEIMLFLPPPPLQPRTRHPSSSLGLNSKSTFMLKKAWKRFQPKLEAIPEMFESHEPRPGSWIALYQYLPRRKRHAMYAQLD
ncbi:unnamed protein product [Periconia digitata]|uniref:Uncharacterized protein n=1 Tax=Periconia digitata TaxID=1303443 RepID=A0A9W4UML1_9PLEO|nr:unnamed protein product [Periconia digitata]